MESVKILRELWRRRLYVAVVGAFAFAIAWLLMFGTSFPPKSASYQVGIASARILIDTPQSQVVAVDPKGSDMLGSRASVLANLMVYGELKDQVAKRAGLRSNKLIAGTDTTGGAAAAAKLGRDSHALTTGVVVNTELAQLPLLKIDTEAPTPAEATRLANAAVTELITYVNGKANTQGVASDRRLRITPLGPPQAHLGARGIGKMMGLAAAIFVFLAGCAVIVVVSNIVRAWREAAALERGFVPEDAEVAQLFANEPGRATVAPLRAGSRR